ncbi:nucleoside transmembrane transporter activity protein [Phytophthora oleae]|uniref:Nucleoside transmembrane transporter activity protein n=1 Tax=Phytophthora oleae TaxID=2107226 RepID=A0ABD3FUN4_9STRA
MTASTATALLFTLGMQPAVLSQAMGHVDLFQDADFKHKLTRVRNVQTDTCYKLACSTIDNVVTPAKWSGLPDTGSTFKSSVNIILFFTGTDCHSKFRAWPVVMQSDDSKYFPENFRLDGINDAISSFLVADEWKVKSTKNICSEASILDNSTCSRYACSEEVTVTTSTLQFV